MKTTLLVLAIACASVTGCLADEINSPFGQLLPTNTYRLTSPFEARLGVYEHELGGVEGGSADISGDVIFGNVAVSTDHWWDFVTMRGHLGGTYNTNNMTDGIYAGPIWTIALTKQVFIEGSLDGAWNDGVTNGVKPPGRAGMGCHYSFHESASIGYNITEHWSVMATVEHYSNLSLCDANHGITNVGARVGYTF
jgi:hypothetical protein